MPFCERNYSLGGNELYVTDNSDLMMMRDALRVTGRDWFMYRVSFEFCSAACELPCLAFTHFQPAQPTTVGKRATLWAYDLVLDLQELDHRLEVLAARSAKGTTGTQASSSATLPWRSCEGAIA